MVIIATAIHSHSAFHSLRTFFSLSIFFHHETPSVAILFDTCGNSSERRTYRRSGRLRRWENGSLSVELSELDHALWKKFCVPLTLIIRKIQGFSQLRRPVKRWIQDNQVDLSLYKAKDVEAFFRTIGYRCARLVATFQQYIQVTHLTWKHRDNMRCASKKCGFYKCTIFRTFLQCRYFSSAAVFLCPIFFFGPYLSTADIFLRLFSRTLSMLSASHR